MPDPTAPYQGQVLSGAPSQSIEEQIAKYITDNNISVMPESGGGLETLYLFQFRGTEYVEIAKITYNDNTGVCLPADLEELNRRHTLPGLVNGLTRPLVKLIRLCEGDFYHERFNSIHTALNSVEETYGNL